MTSNYRTNEVIDTVMYFVCMCRYLITTAQLFNGTAKLMFRSIAMAFISTSYILYYKVLLNIYFVSSPFREVCALLGAPLKVSFIIQYSSYCIIFYCLLRFTFCSLDLFIFHPFGETIYCFIGSTYCIRFITSCYCLYL